MFTRWQSMLETTPGHELAETILEESGYTEMWQNDRSADAPTRLENLKELVETISGFESMRAFLEHVALVMDTDNNPDLDAVSIMTLHSAKGLEFETVFLPGWEEGLFPHQRALDEGGRSGLEEERRLAYVGLTRAKRHCHIWFVSNRRIHGLWQSTLPSRFLDELPEAHVEVAEMDTGYGGYGRSGRFGASGGGHSGGPYGASRFDKAEPFAGNYNTPGWKRAQANKTDAARDNWGTRSGHAVERIAYGESGPRGATIEGELVAKSTGTTSAFLSATASSTSNSATATSLHRRQQADHRFRQGRPEAGAGRVCGAGWLGHVACSLLEKFIIRSKLIRYAHQRGGRMVFPSQQTGRRKPCST
jgi:DNA helicase-2/ATP-dependent DNA helicase PcrA